MTEESEGHHEDIQGFRPPDTAIIPVVGAEAPRQGAELERRAGGWLAGGGEMARLILAKDWSRTPLGPIDRWPQSLRTTVSLIQASNFPISIAWGPGNVQIYNDGYWPLCGAKHPTSMGQDFWECWASAFPVIGEAYHSAWAGKSAFLENVQMFLDRHGYLEEAWFTFSFSPITDENGRIAGLFHPVTETTAQVLSKRRIKMLRDLASRTVKSRSIDEALALSAQVFAESGLDLPFTLLYLVEADARHARLVSHSGILPDTVWAPPAVDFTATQENALASAVATAAGSGGAVQLDDMATCLAGQVRGPYAEPPRQALALPVRMPGLPKIEAVVVAGVSPRLQLNEAYRDFCEMTAAAVGRGLANARAHEEERRRAEALAEIDRAKTAFFSNISHEFRTPLTLILGPLADALAAAEPMPAWQHERVELAHRNSIRLLRLINTLLNFARIEAGRTQLRFRPTELGRYTAELASSFRSAMDKAGLSFEVQCPPLPALVFVDRDMWEQIVLNLLSNAFKHTFHGAVQVRLDWRGDHVELVVADTGVGIPEAEMSRVFERFHRIKHMRSRTHEGSGIGLALVQEVVRLHGGRIQVASEEGRGTTFTVSIPTGSAHLPPEHIDQAAAECGIATISTLAASYSQEAIQWLPDDGPSGEPPPPHVIPAGDQDRSKAPGGARRPCIVWADDNADMRAYVRRLLEVRYEVIAVADGEAALAAVKASRPDLVLADVMMPKLDGLGLLDRLREDPSTRAVPFVLLSARAGEEAAVGGLAAGADDYLAKPFSAKELLARVRAHIDLSLERRKWTRQLERTNAELAAFSSAVSHDLRAPLTSVKGYAELLALEHGPRLDERARDYLRRIEKNAEAMLTLIEGLLRLAHASRVELRKVRVDLGKLATDIVEELRSIDPERQVKVAIAAGMEATADPALTGIILSNLLRNAWKFTAKRSDARIDFGVHRIGDEDVFFVADNGAGFDMAKSAELFKPFHRLHAASDFSGTGIGLTTVRQIVDRHGGRVWAEAAFGRGATFYFTLEGSADA